MQDNRTVSANEKNITRNKPNSAVVSSKSSRPVAKRRKGSVSAKRVANLHAVRAPRVISMKKKDKAPFPWSVVVVAAIMTGLFLFMMMNYAEVDKYRSEINDINDKIETMEKTQNDLQVTLSNKYDLAAVREYAEAEGMVDGNEMEKHYITNQQEDKTEMNAYDDGEEGGFGFLLTGFGEVLGDFLN